MATFAVRQAVRMATFAAQTAIGLLLMVSILALPREARASGEVWVWHEQQVRLDDGRGAYLPRTDFRFMSSTRFSGRAEGLELLLVRAGPIVHAAPWFAVATHGVAVAGRTPGRTFQQEYRWEIDLVPHTRLGDVVVSDRNRFEYINRPGGAQTRYRQMLHVMYAPKATKWRPFAFHEFFLRVTDPGLQETWSAVGVGRVLTRGVRLDLAYMLRARYGARAGETDHVAWTMLVFGIPRAAPPPSAGPPPSAAPPEGDDHAPSHGY